MFSTTGNTEITKTTSWKVVLPFYGFAAISFLIANILLLLSSSDVTTHYFLPHTLAITHIMALGWGTMMILGASHQLVPVLIEGELYSNKLAYVSFTLAALGIPFLIYGFYVFDMGLHTQCGGILIILAIIIYLINLAVSMVKSNHESVHAFFIFTAAIWLLATTIVGLLLLYNFTQPMVSTTPSMVALTLAPTPAKFISIFTAASLQLIELFVRDQAPGVVGNNVPPAPHPQIAW